MKVRIKYSDIPVFLLAVLCVVLLSPAIAKTIGGIAIILIAVLCFLSEINLVNSCSGYEKNTLLLVVLYLAMIYAYRFLGISTASISHHMITLRFFLPFICILPIYRRLTKRQIYFLIFAVVIAMSVTMLWNVHLKNQWGYRYSYQLSNLAGERGVINTQYTTAIMLASGVLFCAFLRGNKGIVRYGCLIGTILCVYFNIAVTQRAIAFFLSIIMIVFLLMVNSKRHTAFSVVSFVVFLLLLLFVTLEYENVLNWLAGAVKSTRLQKRIYSVINLIQAETIEDAGAGSLTVRLRLMGVSVKTFFGSFSHFFLGVGHRISDNTLVGNHSQFVDEFARFGLFGGLLSTFTIIRLLKEIRIMADLKPNSVARRHITVLLLVVVMRIFIGSVFDSSVGIVLFVLVPLVFRTIQIEEENG